MVQPSIKLYFRRSGYSDEDFESFSEAFNDRVEVQLKPRFIPEAGASFDLDIILQYLGMTIASGALWDILKIFPVALAKLWDFKHRQRGFAPDIGHVTLKLSDVEITLDRRIGDSSPDVVFLSKDVINNIDSIISEVVNAITKPPFSNHSVEKVLIYCRNTQESAQTTLYNPNFRVKLVSEENYFLYDSDMQELFLLKLNPTQYSLENAPGPA